jgi:hypothetical protein
VAQYDGGDDNAPVKHSRRSQPHEDEVYVWPKRLYSAFSSSRCRASTRRQTKWHECWFYRDIPPAHQNLRPRTAYHQQITHSICGAARSVRDKWKKLTSQISFFNRYALFMPLFRYCISRDHIRLMMALVFVVIVSPLYTIFTSVTTSALR